MNPPTTSEPLETVLKGTYRHKRSGTIYTRVTVQNGIYTVTNEKGSQYFVNGDKLERVPLETPSELDEIFYMLEKSVKYHLDENQLKVYRSHKRVAKQAIERLIADEVRKAFESVQNEINEQMAAANDNLAYHVNHKHSERVIKEWEGTVFGIKLIDDAVAQLSNTKGETE